MKNNVWLLQLKKSNWCYFTAFLLVNTFIFRASAQQGVQDSTISQGEGIYSVFKKFENLKFSGYIQPQFQVAQSAGTPSFAGGDFAANSNSRFMLRRGRVRMEYTMLHKDNLPSVSFAFQFDINERRIQIRDFYGKIYENRFNKFHLTTGMFSRPFGFEVNYSSSQRESPERGRMSQTLFRNERDLGLMLSLEPQRKDDALKNLRIEAGLFNGTGVAAPTDYDSHKDFIGRVSLKPTEVAKNLTFSGSVSHYNGGMRQFGKQVYRLHNTATGPVFQVDSAETNIGKIATRRYYGADVQLKILNKWGTTELRGEFITGRQPGLASTSEVPAIEPIAEEVTIINNQPFTRKVNLPIYHRKFNGAYFYLIQDIKTNRDQIAIKYDWYDPNQEVKNREIGRPGDNTTEADIKFSTLSGGYIHNFNNNVRLTIWYDWVKNQATQLPKYSHDYKDNILTIRMMYRF
ncbi:porin [Adhaeribacter radiodurans]|uniref:Porin n=1 Tax=Adhaeribacter radiodurans TaxID=2745197 RepID=A0A7L7L536_9BACT|nr:porin [Adhaeribacter radiodurans]QMU27499.1 porin [Adhaeribacter radiodurans]